MKLLEPMQSYADSGEPREDGDAPTDPCNCSAALPAEGVLTRGGGPVSQ